LSGRTIPLLVTLIAIGVFAVGCGDNSSSGSSDDGTIETSSLSKSEFVKRANAICTESSEGLFDRLGAYLNENASSSKHPEEVAADAMRQAVLPGVEQQIEEIRELGAPSGSEEQIEAFLVVQERSVESLKQQRSLSLNTDVTSAFKRAGQLAKRYGIQACDYG
jgi:hypothetical protein